VVPDGLAPRASYDRIAHLYDVDMARNMAFDDIALYTQLAERAGSRALELGCGNGRIMLELLDHGIDAIGIDCSPGMLSQLRQKATVRGLVPKLCLMDARALAFTNAFAMVLCPYSLITYMTGADDAARMLAAIRGVLAPGATVVIDAFIPRPTASGTDFSLDYRRDHGDAILTRSKRVAAIAPRVNRIERQYELVAADGRLLERIETSEDVRLYSPEDLVLLLNTSGFVIEQQWWDYAAGERPAEAQFFTLSAHSAA
jgi:ubiquinone/menaquinone biosynthesis C-methylase UbiE